MMPWLLPLTTTAGVVSAEVVAGLGVKMGNELGADTNVVDVISGVELRKDVLRNELDAELGRPRSVAMLSVSELDERMDVTSVV